MSPHWNNSLNTMATFKPCRTSQLDFLFSKCLYLSSVSDSCARGCNLSSYRFTWTEQAVTGHAVRSIRYRYIYYPEINLEELYDHENDPKEWNNIAYKEENKRIIDEHRGVLLGMLPQLTWRAGDPEGYSIDADGNVCRNDGE